MGNIGSIKNNGTLHFQLKIGVQIGRTILDYVTTVYENVNYKVLDLLI